jgi:hypothetical protein
MDELADDYKSFASALGCREILKLTKLGIPYRVPPPGGSIDASGMLSANSELPCTIIMYSTDQGSTWSYYVNPVHIGAGQVAHLKSMSSDWSLQSRVVVVADECSDCDASVGSSVELVDSGSNGNSDTSMSLPDQGYNKPYGDSLNNNEISDMNDSGMNHHPNENHDILNAWTEGMKENVNNTVPAVTMSVFAVFCVVSSFWFQ